VRAHLQALDERARLLRFGHIASDEQIGLYVEQMDFGRDELYGVFDRRLRLVAMAHLAFDNDGLEAEFGVSVLPRARGKGLGTRLFEHAVMHARNRGVSNIVIYVARENIPMLAIVHRAGAQISFDGAQAVARLQLPADTLGTQLGALLDGHAAEFDYQVKLQVLRLDGLWPSWSGKERSAGSSPSTS
jgi:GNAT superfamily N-acetyltransferase